MELEWIKLGFKLLTDSKTRHHLAGYRPEVICFVKSTGAENKFLLVVPEQDHSIWIPPQEGIEMDETVEEAAVRCLEVELGWNSSQIHFRRSIWIGKRILPKARWDERDLSQSLRGLAGKERMIGKAYYAALIIADSNTDVKLNQTEIYDWDWVSGTEFMKRIATNDESKVEIILAAWKRFFN